MPRFDFVGCLVTCNGALHVVCQSEESASSVADLLNLGDRVIANDLANREIANNAFAEWQLALAGDTRKVA